MNTLTSMRTCGNVVYLLDTYAWVEYFIGSKKGEQVKGMVEDSNNVIYTPECCIAELKGWAIRESVDFEELYRIVRKLSDIQCITTGDWLDAADLRSEMRKKAKDFGMMDALILAQQRRLGCKGVRGDVHFEGVEDTVLL
ncbi:MAG: PIN domain-containing protein [ANME-2 cluster archaeon]|nr:PIN domain-containing protein [ANME-2 cluster archaeon]